MNPLLIIQDTINSFTEELLFLCKPLMTDAVHKKTAAQLLSAESNLRMTIEFAVEAVEKKDMKEKLTLSLEETELIYYLLASLPDSVSEKKAGLVQQAEDIKQRIENCFVLTK